MKCYDGDLTYRKSTFIKFLEECDEEFISFDAGYNNVSVILTTEVPVNGIPYIEEDEE